MKIVHTYVTDTTTPLGYHWALYDTDLDVDVRPFVEGFEPTWAKAEAYAAWAKGVLERGEIDCTDLSGPDIEAELEDLWAQRDSGSLRIKDNAALLVVSAPDDLGDEAVVESVWCEACDQAPRVSGRRYCVGCEVCTQCSGTGHDLEECRGDHCKGCCQQCDVVSERRYEAMTDLADLDYFQGRD